jgi:hypothetical protein
MIMIRRLGAFSTLLILLALAACGGDGAPAPSPASPSSPAVEPPLTNGATISGTVNGIAGSSGYGSVGARDIVTVTATAGGVTVTSTIDAQGNFVLTGLPGGTITLSFTGTSATVVLANVAPKEKIKIIVTISGGTATLESQESELDGLVQLEGRISSYTSLGSFYVGSTAVNATGASLLTGDETPFTGTLKVGDRVHVKGNREGETMMAKVVIVQNTNTRCPSTPEAPSAR